MRHFFGLSEGASERRFAVDRFASTQCRQNKFAVCGNIYGNGDDINLVIDYAPKLFALPQEKKDKLLMRNNLHFLGYTSIGAEYTKGKADQREQYDFATPYECPWTPGAPEYLKLWGPAQVSGH